MANGVFSPQFQAVTFGRRKPSILQSELQGFNLPFLLESQRRKEETARQALATEQFEFGKTTTGAELALARKGFGLQEQAQTASEEATAKSFGLQRERAEAEDAALALQREGQGEALGLAKIGLGVTAGLGVIEHGTAAINFLKGLGIASKTPAIQGLGAIGGEGALVPSAIAGATGTAAAVGTGTMATGVGYGATGFGTAGSAAGVYAPAAVTPAAAAIAPWAGPAAIALFAATKLYGAHQKRKATAKSREDYHKWYKTLSNEQQLAEDERIRGFQVAKERADAAKTARGVEAEKIIEMAPTTRGPDGTPIFSAASKKQLTSLGRGTTVRGEFRVTPSRAQQALLDRP